MCRRPRPTRETSPKARHRPSHPKTPDLPDQYSTHARYPLCQLTSSYVCQNGLTSLQSEQQPHPAVQLPPIRSRSASAIPSSVATASCLPRGSRRTHPQSEIPRTQPQRPELRSSSHSFDVFVASGQGLVHQRTSTKDDFRQSSKEDAISASTGKFICPHCGRRFEKSSHFKATSSLLSPCFFHAHFESFIRLESFNKS